MIKNSNAEIREKYISSNHNQYLKKLKRRESEKAKWKYIKKVFGKCKLKSILVVEYLINGTIIRTTAQYEMEEAVMTKNSNRFSLAYTLPIFNLEIIKQIGFLGQSNKVHNLVKISPLIHLTKS